MEKSYHLSRKSPSNLDLDTLLLEGINRHSFKKKGMSPIESIEVSIQDDDKNRLGGAKGVILHGSLHLDMLWVNDEIRGQGLGSKLMKEIEKIAKEYDCAFISVNTMSFEAMPFYKKNGYHVEFTREGFSKDSQMYMLRKNL